MANGRPTMILWDGWDCGNCRATAPTISNYINANKDKINFLLAYGGIAGSGECGTESNGKSIASWMKDYPGYKNVKHSFLDNDITYCHAVHSLPHYTLIDGNKKLVLRTHQNEGNNPWGRISAKADELMKITAIDTKLAVVEHFNMYPNPSKNLINISLQLHEALPIKAHLVNILGNEVATLFIGNTHMLSIATNIEHIAPGSYRVVIKTNDHIIINKFLVIN